MRHANAGRKFDRDGSSRAAMFKNLVANLFANERIETTVPKAKELRRVVEPLITLGKTDTDARRRLAFARLRDPAVVEKLFTDLGPRFKARAGGYTRILKMMPRPGDSAPMALMQLVDRPAAAEAPAADEAPAKKPRKKAAKPAAEAAEGEAAKKPRRKKAAA